MKTLTKRRAMCGASRKSHPLRFCGARTKSLWLLLLAATMVLSACGGGTSGGSQINLTLSGNWQFTMSPQIEGNQAAYLGGLEGGFLLQNGGAVTGASNYAVSLPQLPYPCNSGSAAITGTINGQNVTLTAVAGTQTFTLTGMLSVDGLTMAGTYASTAGTAPDGSACGIAETGLQWGAILVPPITGAIQGNFHSTGGSADLSNQDFPVSGSITQAANTGANSAAVSGTLSFVSQGGATSDYPCIATATVYGQISGNSVTLQLVGNNDSILAQIGAPAGSNGVTGISPVTFDSVQGGYILHAVGPSYLVATTTCPGSLSSIATAGDYGDICLAVESTFGGANACQQPITLTPATVALTYPPPIQGMPSTQAVTLANVSSGALSGITMTFANVPISAANFTETDTCGAGGVPSQGQPFNLSSGQSCVITITFTPQCTTQCGSPTTATLTVTSPVSADNDTVFTVPITGTVTGDDNAEAISGASGSELLSFDNSVARSFANSFSVSFDNCRAHPARILTSSSNRTLPDVEHHAEID